MSRRSVDELKQIMIQDGIKQQQFVSEVDHFKQCPLCLDPFEKEKPPDLLECGHLCCSNCSKELFCAKCSQNRKISAKNYTVIFDYFQATYGNIKKETTYHFNIRNTSEHNSLTILNVTSESTIAQVLMQSIDFSNYLKVTQDKTGFSICSKGVLYSQCKDKTIADIIKENKIRLKPSSTHKFNEIFYYDYYKGG